MNQAHIICSCSTKFRVTMGCPKHDVASLDPSGTITRGKLLAHNSPPLPPWCKTESTESSTFDYCAACGEGVRTAWPATIAQIEKNRTEFVEGHQCPGRPTP